MTDNQTSEASSGSGSSREATLAGLLLVVLDDRWKLLKLLLVFLGIALILLGSVWVVVHLVLPSNASEIQFGPAHIQLSQSGGSERKYLVAVSPSGWVRTSIQVRKGDHLTIEADGKVYVDLAGLNDAIRARRDAEARLQEKWDKEGVDAKQLAPEDFFLKEGIDMNKLKPRWNWNGPDGISEEDMKLARPARRERSILPKEGYGTLLGSLYEADAEPADLVATATQHLISSVFRVGSSFNTTVDRDGYLYFVVNDVQGPKEFPNMFFVDNIGTFYAKVTVAPPK